MTEEKNAYATATKPRPRRVPPPPNCGHCGRFTWVADAYDPWGGGGDQEPPEPVLLCRACAAAEYDYALRGILATGLLPFQYRSAYVPSGAWQRARAVARAMFKRGTPRPTIHVRARYETTGRGDESRVQEWCTCGWTTGSLPSRNDRAVDYLMPGRLISEHIEAALTAPSLAEDTP